MINRRFLFAAFGAIALVSAEAAGQGKSEGRGKAKGTDGPAKPSVSAQVSVVFGDRDRAAVRDWFVAHPINASALPPGIAKNLARGKPLPPGIAKKVVPAGAMVLLPKPAPGITFSVFGDNVVALRDGKVVDVMLAVVR